MDNLKFDVVIIGGGMVGLALAFQLKKKFPNISIVILEKEIKVGLHSSGRNSGVLHAGIYYQPNTIKAKVCIEGAKRLIEWCEEEKIKILKCGKVITPQKIELDQKLETLYNRAKINGAKVEIINQSKFDEIVPFGRTSSGRAIWSPNTAVVKPKEILERLTKRLQEKGVQIFTNMETKYDFISKNLLIIRSKLKPKKEYKIHYGHLFNCGGTQADRIARKFGLARNFIILPFKGIYWKLNPQSDIKLKSNLYPVPDLDIPFLGVHATPSPDGTINFGPTALPALGRENYKIFESIEPVMAIDFFKELIFQFMKDNGGFRSYAREQVFQGLKPVFFRAAKQLIPSLKPEDLIPSEKIGIRAQLYDKNTSTLIQDFKIESTKNSTHILNTISPAFTASFSLADLIIDESNFAAH